MDYKEIKTEKELLSTISHKLKSPLTTINLYSEAMLTGSVGKVSDEQREYLEEIHQASKKMVQNVNDLMKIVTINSINKK